MFENSEEDTKDFVARIKRVYFCIAAAFLIIFSRLWFLQIIQGDELREFSEKNRVKEVKIRAPRGLILDREGRILVDNIAGHDAVIYPQYTLNIEDTASQLGTILNIESAEIVNAVSVSRRKNGVSKPVTIKENLSLEEVYRIKKIRIDYPGLDVEERILRYYPLEQNGAQMLGYVAEISKKQIGHYNKKNNPPVPLQQGDLVGQSGLEEVWDLSLRGQDGIGFIEVDAHGREAPKQNKAFLELKPRAEVSGNNLVLTIDKDIQLAAEKAMLEQKDKIGPRIGGIVAMKTNGEILAWVNTPSFNPNRFARGISNNLWSKLINDQFKPLRNKVIQDHYSPGSTIKPIIASAALQEKIIKPTTIVSAPGQMKFGNRVYHDTLRGGHGEITVYRAIESSSNIFFYKMGIQLQIDAMSKYAKLFGLGQKTGIDLSNEVAGNFPSREWKLKTKGEPWQPGENLSNAIGQSYVLTTILQMTLAYNAIGTEGNLVKPLLVKRVVSPNGQLKAEYEPKILRDISTPTADDPTYVDKKNLEVIREAMRRVANAEHGTARHWKIPGIEMAGKTGTSQVMSFSAEEIYKRCESRPITQRHHGSYIAFAPFVNPEIIVGALTEHSCHGNVGSTPVVRDVILAYVQKYHPELLKVKNPIIKEVTPIIEEINEVGE